MSKEKRITQARSKLLATEGKRIKRMTYLFAVISVSLNFFGTHLYERGAYKWYELPPEPILLVGFGVMFTVISFITNSSLFIMKTAVKGRISAGGVLWVYVPFFFMLVNLIKHPFLYYLPIAAGLMFLAKGRLIKKIHSSQ